MVIASASASLPLSRMASEQTSPSRGSRRGAMPPSESRKVATPVGPAARASGHAVVHPGG